MGLYIEGFLRHLKSYIYIGLSAKLAYVPIPTNLPFRPVANNPMQAPLNAPPQTSISLPNQQQITGPMQAPLNASMPNQLVNGIGQTPSEAPPTLVLPSRSPWNVPAQSSWGEPFQLLKCMSSVQTLDEPIVCEPQTGPVIQVQHNGRNKLLWLTTLR